MSSLGPAKSSQAFRTIAEASEELDVPAHVLRFWEGKFTQIKPLKRAGGRRHYRPDDMALLRGIRALLQEDGYQIKGVQKLLKDQGIAWVRDRGQGQGQGQGQASAQSDDHNKTKVSGYGNALPEQAAAAGPLFETISNSTSNSASPENISPAAAILLRKALAKLEKARQLLDNVAKHNSARTNTL